MWLNITWPRDFITADMFLANILLADILLVNILLANIFYRSKNTANIYSLVINYY
jgi:hypothetical protein